MAFVVTEPCFGCKYTDCLTDCPVECFHEGEQMLFIDPESCICCGACVALCPVEAIFDEDQVPEEWHEYIELNAEMSKVCPSITEKKSPLAGGSSES
jgi:ferredoxin